MFVSVACTRNWYIHLATMIYALFKHNKVDKLYLFIEDDEISYLKDDRIDFINVNKLPEYIMEYSPNYKTKYTKMTFVRCYLSKILKEDRILYIDADAIVIDNIEDLWNIELGDNVVVGVHEPGEWSKHLGIEGMDDKYINTGILLMDLAKIRELKLDDEMLQLLNTNKYWLPDQDVINIVCKDKIKYVSNMYNSTETTGFRNDAKIIHYIRERKGWVKGSPRSEIWYNYHREMIGGNKMDNYKVIATRDFDDIEKGEHRVKGKSEWFCSADRYEYLKKNNAVELIEIKKVELPKEETKVEIKEEPKIIETIHTTIGKVGYGPVEVKETTPKKKKTSKKKGE